MDRARETSRHGDDAESIRKKYPSFDASKTTVAQCFFCNTGRHKCIDDLGKIISEGQWAISYVYYKDSNNNGITSKIDLILKDIGDHVLDVTLYFTQPQAIDNLKILFRLEDIDIGGIRCPLPNTGKNLNYGFTPEFPHIDYFITLASGCFGSVTTLLKRGYVERVEDITK